MKCSRVHCKREAVSGTKSCQECTDITKRSFEKRRAAAESAGLCNRCHKRPARANRKTCEECAARTLANSSRLRDKDRDRYREYSRQTSLRIKYGIDAKHYDAMLVQQSGVCALCGKACVTGRRLAVDHCHTTGVIRGLLCCNCNRVLGIVEDIGLDKITHYLRKGKNAEHQ